MKQPEKFDDNAPAEVADPKKQRRIQRLDAAISYYASRKHVVFTIMGAVFGIVELNYGVKYSGQCPIQPMIAIFLIVHGSVMLLEVAIGILAILISRVIYVKHDQVLARRLIFAVFLSLIFVNLFCFAWFIAGNIWVFGSITDGYQNSNSAISTTYCEIDLFRAAFGIIISRYIIVTVIIIVIFVSKRREIMRCCIQEEAPPVDKTESVHM